MTKFSRRQALMGAGRGLGAVALAGMLELDGVLPKAQAAAVNPLAPKQPHFPPKAKSVIWLHMHGAPATIDLFDYKPDLIRLAGQPVPDSFGKIELGTAGGRGPRLVLRLAAQSGAKSRRSVLHQVQDRRQHPHHLPVPLQHWRPDGGTSLDGRLDTVRAGFGQSGPAGFRGAHR